jgi:hypothetical protein
VCKPVKEHIQAGRKPVARTTIRELGNETKHVGVHIWTLRQSRVPGKPGADRQLRVGSTYPSTAGIGELKLANSRRFPANGRSPPKANRGCAEQMPTLSMCGSAQTRVNVSLHAHGR